MRLRIDFGHIRKEIPWWRPIEEFPKLLSLYGRKYEWFMYKPDATKQVDHILLFSELPSYDPNSMVTMDSWENMFAYMENNCVCGAAYSSFSWDHMRYCPLWSRW